MDAAVARLTERGLLDEHGLTEDGVALRGAVEEATDMLSVQPFSHLGVDRTERVVALAKGMARTLLAGGAYPAGVLAGGSR